MNSHFSFLLLCLTMLCGIVLGGLSGWYLSSHTSLFAGYISNKTNLGYQEGSRSGVEALKNQLDTSYELYLEKFPLSVLRTYRHTNGNGASGVVTKIEGRTLHVFINNDSLGTILPKDQKNLKIEIPSTTPVMQKQSLKGHQDDYLPGEYESIQPGQLIFIIWDSKNSLKEIQIWPKVYLNLDIFK